MMKKRINMLLFFIVGCNIAANAQKLPNVQQGEMRATTNIKIDGKTNEWNFVAYNKNTEVYYTIANDDADLYLIVKAVKPDIVDKLIFGGLTLTVNASGKKSEK